MILHGISDISYVNHLQKQKQSLPFPKASIIFPPSINTKPHNRKYAPFILPNNVFQMLTILIILSIA